ncbi:MAG TPA: TraR/DksA C4-type zinc finger protein [Propionibacteriaceae bacterium]|nr:TraR/DksA C4-type zinc finger protein [Propionibacteriaceae bacterium]
MRQKIDTVRTTTTSAAELENQFSTLREELDQQRRFRREQLEELALEAGEAVSTADQNRLQVNRLLTLAAKSALSEIDSALQRLEEGSFGICERCAEPIPWERLEVLPMSRLCTPCQYLADSCRSNGVLGGQTRSRSGIR